MRVTFTLILIFYYVLIVRVLSLFKQLPSFPFLLSAVSSDNRLCFIGKCLVSVLFIPYVCSVYPYCLLLAHERG